MIIGQVGEPIINSSVHRPCEILASVIVFHPLLIFYASSLKSLLQYLSNLASITPKVCNFKMVSSDATKHPKLVLFV